ncbi:hypothetical protein Tco_1019756 [Tanacetum coccineum]|uniref:Uncharacterized protein n=1 Tax=Tanacetum coccineum TaxID=301880 RepID=A0ABQ5FY99_9ASTR
MPEDSYSYVVAAFQALPSPDYVPGPEYPPLPDFVPEQVYLEFMPLEEEVLPAEEKPLPVAISPTADSPSYVPELDPEEDLEEDDDEDPEEDPADYPADGGDDGNDEDESSDEDEDDEDVDIEGDEEEEEHPAHQLISIRDEPPTPFWSDTEVAKLLAIPTPPPSPLSPWSSPLPQIPSPPLPPIVSQLPVSPPLPVSSPPPASPIRSLRFFYDDDQKKHIDMNSEKIAEQNQDTYGPTYVDPDCYYEEADAIKEVQLLRIDKARRRFQFYPYDKDIRYLIEQIRGDIEELEKKKKKNDVM